MNFELRKHQFCIDVYKEINCTIRNKKARASLIQFSCFIFLNFLQNFNDFKNLNV